MEAPLVAIGGTLCDGRVWAPALRSAGLEARHVVAGRTVDGREGAPSMARYAAELLAGLPPRFNLAGFSLGGLIALEMVAQQPERVARLALVGAGAGPETPEGAAVRRAGATQAEAKGLAEHVREDLWPRYHAQVRDADRILLPLLASMAEAVGLATYKVQISLALSRADSRPRLAALAMPLLLVCGGADRLCPPERHAEIAERVPSARRETLADCGHFAPLERPQAVRELLRDWLAK